MNILNFERLGIVTGEQKWMLENLIGSDKFDQRKDYDEYYVNIAEDEFLIEVDELLILSKVFKIVIDQSKVFLEDL